MTPRIVRLCFVCGERTFNGAITCPLHVMQGVEARRVRSLIIEQSTEMMKIKDPANRRNVELYRTLSKDCQFKIAYLVSVVVAEMKQKSLDRRGYTANFGVFGGLDLILSLARGGYI